MVTWISITKVFNSILVYNSLISLVKNSEGCEFISWYENQIGIRSFPLGFSYVKKKFNSYSSLSTFFGSPIVLNSRKQYFPTHDEFKKGFWGEKFYLQDVESYEEMNEYINKNKIPINTAIVKKSMQRIIKNCNKKIFKSIRNITILLDTIGFNSLFNCTK